MEYKILIVDDAKFARNVMKRALKSGNYTNLIEATNAKDALEIFEKEKPDLTMLDISLPDSNDLGLLKNMLEVNPESKIVMCSALGQNMIITQALKIGAKDFISKPYEEKVLLDVVSNVLTEKGAK